MKIFSDQMVKNYVMKMARHLKKSFPTKTEHLSDKQLELMVQDGISKAAQYGIDIEDDVQKYVECMVIYGKDFDVNENSEWSSKILKDTSITGTMKARRLAKYITQVVGA